VSNHASILADGMLLAQEVTFLTWRRHAFYSGLDLQKISSVGLSFIPTQMFIASIAPNIMASLCKQRL